MAPNLNVSDGQVHVVQQQISQNQQAGGHTIYVQSADNTIRPVQIYFNNLQLYLLLPHPHQSNLI